MSEHRHHPMTEAARNLDAIAEEHGLEYTVDSLGLDLNALSFVASQRAMRIVIITSRGPAAMRAINTGRPEAVRFTPTEQAMLERFTLALLDGLVIGWKAREISENDKEHNA